MNFISERRLPPELVIKNEIFQELRQRNPLKVFFQSCLNIGAYVLVCLLGIRLNIWWLWPAICFFLGFLLSCFFDAAHECIHSNFARSTRINRLAGILWLLPVFVNFSLFRCYHLEHHKNTKLPDDPEPSGVFSSLWEYVLIFPTAVFYSPLVMTVQASLGRLPVFAHSEKMRRDVQLDNLVLCLWLVCTVTCTVIFRQYAFLCYWFPFLFVYPIGCWSVIAEHYDCDQDQSPLCNTRSLSSNLLFRCFVWNGNYHAEHHAYPSIPAYSLPRLHTIIGKHFKYQERSYILFHWKLIRSLLPNHNSSRNGTIN